MKIAVFSDTHLTEEFDKQKYDFLRRIIQKADKVIINGDFWDSDHTIFDDFIESKWSELFPLLKSKNTIYIDGNHDPIELMDSKTDLFCDKVVSTFEIKKQDCKLHFTHGHFAKNRSKSFLLLKDLLKKVGPLKDFSKNRERILILLTKEKYFGRKYLNRNNTQKERGKISLSNVDILVCSHTHRPEYDLANGYINTGMIGYGYGQYLVVDIDLDKDKITNIELKYEKY